MALIKENGGSTDNKTLTTLFLVGNFKNRSMTIMHTDNAESAIAKAETLMSSKTYPIHELIIIPAGYRPVSKNNKQIKIDIAFFI